MALIIYKLHFIRVFDLKVKKYLKYKPKRKPKAVIYSAGIGSYDKLIVPNCIDFDIDYVFYTDNEKLLSKNDTVWEFRPAQYMELDNVRNSRWHKTQPHLLFPENKISKSFNSTIIEMHDDKFWISHCF